ncbi:MAG: type II/IV secretion system protein [Deltaproteobacteria bacterium]|nr:type II/IV secretion system protein [Deltaproteobacteria bacterium]
METDFFKPKKPGNTAVALSHGVPSQGTFKSAKAETYSAKSLSACSTPEARKFLDFEPALRLGALPLGVIKLIDQTLLTIAVAEDYRPDSFAALKFAVGCKLKLLPVSKEILDDAIFRAYHGDEGALGHNLQKFQEMETCGSKSENLSLPFRPEQGETSKFLAALIDYGISHGASDIHIVPTSRGSRVKLRIAGDLLSHQGEICSLQLHQYLIARIKILAALDTTQRQLPQDGSFQVPLSKRQVSVRVSILPTVHGEKAVLRLLGCEGLIELPALGFDPKTLGFINAFLNRSEGSTLLAGPTGSGKTTSMYALLQVLKERSMSLVSIEDPVEIQLDGVAQTSLCEKNGLTYAACLRAVLRQDPDAILVGEIRDEESAKVAMQAALTGHLLLSTVHARSVLEIFLRLRSLGIDALSVAQAVNLLICQRLLPRLCSNCKVIDLANTNRLGFDVFRGVGCFRCDYSGFDSRALAAEALWMDAGLSAALSSGELEYHKIKENLRPEYYTSLRSSLEGLLRRGDISFDQMLSICAVGV